MNNRIDKVLINEEWKATWSMMLCDLYLGGSSEYVGLELWLHSIEKPRRPFWFQNTWLELDMYNELGTDYWNNEVTRTPMVKINNKLKLVKVATKECLVSQLTLRGGHR